MADWGPCRHKFFKTWMCIVQKKASLTFSVYVQNDQSGSSLICVCCQEAQTTAILVVRIAIFLTCKPPSFLYCICKTTNKTEI